MSLGDLVTAHGASAEEVLDRFLGWVTEQGLTPYPEQEEAILELLADRHVVLSTPTGSGKSLVAQALHFRALCAGERSFYTAPVKALVSEKFFALCEELGADRVGMLTGDASINPTAPVICCTTEVLANMALRGGESTDAPCVVLDEFHYYDDRERGMTWQLPLLVLRHSQFLLMSATIGNTASIEEQLAAFTGRGVAHVHSDVRPVPLDFEYRETPLHETLEDLVARDLAPVYVVNFTQRECGELAQGATSANLASREARNAIGDAIRGFRFDTGYGRDVKRFLSHGVGVHHAGLLPKYRLLVEQLAQQGLLRVIFGTDTLGVGVNVPIRTVVLNRLSKFDGEKVGILRAREFHQIAGRAGRKGFDDRGCVVCQAPEHVIENRRLAQRRDGVGRKAAKKKPPPDFVPWNQDTFEQLVHRPPEALRSQFDVSHGVILGVLQREAGADYAAVFRLVNRSHESDASKARQRRRAAALFRSLVAAGVVELVRARGGGREVRVSPDLQTDFALHDTLSLYVVEAAAALDPDSDANALEVLSLVEAVQEDPRPILSEQTRRARGLLIAKLKAEGVEYEERMRRIEEVTHPKPEEEFLYQTFRLFAERYPWAREDNVRPKSIAREMIERYLGFRDYVQELSLARSEGLLLRYLSQVHNTLVKTLPVAAKTDAVYDVIAFLRTALADVDTSLLEAWESLIAPGSPGAASAELLPALRFDLAQQPRMLTARVRSELLSLVRALATRDYEDAARWVHPDPDDPWDAARFAAALAPFHEEYGAILFTPDARRAHHTALKPAGSRHWEVAQVLVDASGDNLWALHGEVDLRQDRDPEAPLVRLIRIGT